MNGAAAARRAGYAPHTANRIASEILSKPDIRAEIDCLLAEITEQNKLNVKKVLEDLETTRIKAFEDGRLSAALRASELQGKYLNMFTDKIQKENEFNITVVTGIPERDLEC